jgi:hypothetical protein
MASIKIHKNTLKAYLTKLKKKGIESLRIYLIYAFDGMFDGITYINEYRNLTIDELLEDLEKHTIVNLVIEDGNKKVKVFNPSVFSYYIVDDNLNDLIDSILRKVIKSFI